VRREDNAHFEAFLLSPITLPAATKNPKGEKAKGDTRDGCATPGKPQLGSYRFAGDTSATAPWLTPGGHRFSRT
jgi:hypothetical protein